MGTNALATTIPQQRDGSYTAVDLPSEVLAVPLARQWAITVPERLRVTVTVDAMADMELIVSELATNALRHGLKIVGACAWIHKGLFYIGVVDTAVEALPAIKNASETDEHFRGLYLVSDR